MLPTEIFHEWVFEKWFGGSDKKENIAEYDNMKNRDAHDYDLTNPVTMRKARREEVREAYQRENSTLTNVAVGGNMMGSILGTSSPLHMEKKKNYDEYRLNLKEEDSIRKQLVTRKAVDV